MTIITSPIPNKPAGCKNVKLLALPPLSTVKVAFVGLGHRGMQALQRWCYIPHVEIVAVCDVAASAVEKAARLLKEEGKAMPSVYQGQEAYEQLCRESDAHLIYICTDWHTHVPIVLAALSHEKNVAVEVPAAMTLSEIWQIVDAAERVQRHCMMLENSVYDHVELATLEMVRQGLLGEVVHVGGGYAHALGERWTPWRIAYNKDCRGDLYPTHGIGPICRILDIHRSDRMQTLVAMDTAAFTGPQVYQQVMGQECADFSNGDQTSILIRTEKGKTIQLQHNVMTPRPYSRMFEVVGTKGYLSKYPIVQLYLKDHLSISNEHPFSHQKPLNGEQKQAIGYQDRLNGEEDRLNCHANESESLPNSAQIVEQYLPSYVSELQSLAAQLDNRGGMSYFMDYRLAMALHHGKPLDMDVYDLAEWCSITELSRISIENGSMPVAIPNFIRE